MSDPELIAITGARGRVGRALVACLRSQGTPFVEWNRPEYDLDDSESAARLLARDRPAVVIHAAAWTDTEACARQPELARHRNGEATAWLADACQRSDASLVYISTNEVFDGTRTDGYGYVEDDAVNPPNPYGASKLAGEEAARRAFEEGRQRGHLWIVRTAWIFGPPGNDFPTKILAAARARAGQDDPLKVVSDEVGSPTFTTDLAAGIVTLLKQSPQGGLFHLAGLGAASRLEVASQVMARCLPSIELEPISRAEFSRASEPPAWAVLDCSKAERIGVRLRPWRQALNDYLSAIC